MPFQKYLCIKNKCSLCISAYFKLGSSQWLLAKALLGKLIGVNKGRRVTLKYFSLLIKVSRKHRLFIGPGQSKSLIFI